ncbi:PhnB protein putative DNA binding 3-demethylubiquinone-9 3-methyltransferase domain protein [Candidatus Paraburkholderia calva]|nr:PhnB protein putative DNA binding 3-demethylubiquinone-9 3-methyltransferase domain protein [Candidatus Paraburkholderia calva]
MHLDTYLFFHGECAEALALYQTTFGAQIHTLIRFRDTPEAVGVAEQWQDKVLHGLFSLGPNAIMVSDGQFGQPKRNYSGFSLSIAAADPITGEYIFDTLSEGGEILTPWQSNFMTQGFGMLKDRFGVPWLVNVVSHLEDEAYPQQASEAA